MESLLCAKVLFVLAFVNLPMMVADAVILRANGFSVFKELAGLVAEQFLITPALPDSDGRDCNGNHRVGASGPAGLIVWAARHIPQLAVFDGLGFTGPGGLGKHHGRLLPELRWWRHPSLLWQYSRRKTAIARAFCATWLRCCMRRSVPRSPLRMAYAIQSRITNRIDASSIQISRPSTDPWLVHRVAMRDDFVAFSAPKSPRDSRWGWFSAQTL